MDVVVCPGVIFVLGVKVMVGGAGLAKAAVPQLVDSCIVHKICESRHRHGMVGPTCNGKTMFDHLIAISNSANLAVCRSIDHIWLHPIRVANNGMDSPNVIG